MKFKLVETLDERFSTKASRYRHFKDHSKEYPELTETEYEELAEKLAESDVDNIKIFGFKTAKSDNYSRPRYIKYNIETGDYVVYSWEDSFQSPTIISLHKKTKKQYDKQKELYYEDEIPSWL